MVLATLDSMRKKNQKEEAEEKKGETYYTGGAGRDGGSGLAVYGNPEDGPGGGASGEGGFDSIVSRAQATGGASGGGGAGARGAGGGGEEGEEGPPTRTIILWRDGFTLDDGPLRLREDPANTAFLSDLSKGVVPKELEQGASGRQVSVALQDRRTEDYVAPAEPAYRAYSGEGQTLAAPSVNASAVVGGGGTGGGGADGASGAAVEVPEVDSSQPATTLQIRLHDGRRVRAQLNLTHTVAHVQAVVRREGAGDAPYVLMAGFPPAQLTNFSATLEEAGLKGASITQKLA